MNPTRVAQLAEGPIWKLLGLRIRDVSDGEAFVELPVRSDLLQIYGHVHGGLLATLLDAAMSTAVHSQLNESVTWAATTHIDVAYLRPANGVMVSARGHVVKLGAKVAYCQADAWNDEGDIVAQGSAQFYIGYRRE